MRSQQGYHITISRGIILSVGGPALVYWLSPTEEELFKARLSVMGYVQKLCPDIKQKYNPDLQRRSLENREQRQQDFDDFVNKLKGYSKSDKPIWIAAAEDEARQKANKAEERQKIAQDIQKRRELIRDESLRR